MEFDRIGEATTLALMLSYLWLTQPTEKGSKLSPMSSVHCLRSFNQEEELKSSPVMVLANKQDLEGKMNPEEISDILKLSGIADRDWAIFKTSAKTGEGLPDAMTWLAKTVSGKK